MNMNTKYQSMSVIILLAGVLLTACAKSQPPAAAAVAAPGATAASGPHTTFASSDEATEALATALRNNDTKALGELLGPGLTDLLSTGDPVEDTRERSNFLTAYDAGHTLVAGDASDLALLVGEDRWPLPIPLVQRDNRWSWDGAAGIQEILLRRIGADELRTIKVMRGFVDAQVDYASKGHDGLPAGLYAQKLNSTAGKQDGLYWESAAGQPQSPAGPFLAGATAEGYGEKVAAAPYHGYLYRMLNSQGAQANGGAFDYLVDGKLSKGFAAIAYPSNYGSSGIMTFIVSQDGEVWQRDLGEDTATAALAITQFNPDAGWTPLAPES
jgi:Protein of unknown function (DUF2950)